MSIVSIYNAMETHAKIKKQVPAAENACTCLDLPVYA